nr:MAG TPA: hypothetical protein [Caudoviricetes sp.]
MGNNSFSAYDNPRNPKSSFVPTNSCRNCFDAAFSPERNGFCAVGLISNIVSPVFASLKNA